LLRISKYLLTLNGYKYWFIALIFFVIVFLAWSRQPIYTDEATYFRMVAYIYQNDWYRPAIYQVCNEFAKFEVSMVFWPAAYTFSLIADIGSYNGLRYFSLSLFLIVTISYFFKLARTAASPELIFSLMLAMFSGVLLSTISIFRPESFIIITIILLLNISLFGRSPGSVVIFLLLASFTYSMTLLMHAKSLLLFPAFVAALLCVYFKYKNIFLIFMPIFLLISYGGYQMNAAQLVSCPMVPEFDKVLQSWSVNPILLFSHPIRFLREISDVLMQTDFNDIFWKMYYRQHYDYGMLPSLHKAPFAGLSNFLHTTVLASIFVYVMQQAFNAFRVVLSTGIKIKEKTDAILLISLVCTVLFFAFINRVGAWYDKGFWVASFIIIATYGAYKGAKYNAIAKPLLFISITCFVISIGIDLFYMRPILKHEYGTQGMILASHNGRVNDYLEVMKNCSVDGGDNNIVTDDEPVFLTSASKNVYSFHYITQPLGLEDGLSWILNKNSPAIVGRCDQLEGPVMGSGLKNNFELFKVNRACCFKNKNFK
jgi:hypothetical protein